MPQAEQHITEENLIVSQTHERPIDELIGNPPGWLLRSGIGMVALVVFSVLSIAALIKYPDKITSRGELTSNFPPIEVKNTVAGIIQEIYLENNDLVEEGDSILFIKNTAIPADIIDLEKLISDYQEIKTLDQLHRLAVQEDLQVGNIQTEYSALVYKIKEIKDVVKQTSTYDQIKNSASEIKKLKELNQSLEKEKILFQQELQLVEKENNRNQKLASEGLISEQESESTKTKLLQYKQRYEGMSSGIIQNNIRIEQLMLNKLKLNDDRTNLISNYKLSINEIISRLKSGIYHWKDAYFVTAPLSGRINLNSNIVKNLQLEQGQPVGYILNTDKEQINLARAIVPAAGMGKIEKGQKVIIKFDSHPYKEFGVVNATADDISTVPQLDKNGGTFYEVKANLPGTIMTTYDKEIPFKPNTSLTFEIITEEKTILHRLFNQLVDLVKNQ